VAILCKGSVARKASPHSQTRRQRQSAFLTKQRALPWRVCLDLPPVFHLYPACISPYPWYPAVSLCLAIFAAAPLYPAASHCIQLYPCVSSYIQLYLLYPAVSHRIPPPRKRDMAKNTLQGRAAKRRFEMRPAAGVWASLDYEFRRFDDRKLERKLRRRKGPLLGKIGPGLGCAVERYRGGAPTFTL